MTPKQKRFVQEYLVDLNATQAAIRAGYREQNARITASKNLARLDIQAAIAEGMGELARRTEITQGEVLAELKQIAIAPASDAKGSDLRYANKIRALELLGKHLGILTDRISIATIDPAVVDEVESMIREAGIE